MATHDISIAGIIYPDVPQVLLPIDGGGTAIFTDTSDTTATVSDVAVGKVLYSDSGDRIVGTAPGGFTYEKGTFTPSSNVARADISFANSHTEVPIFVGISDTTSPTGITSSSMITWCFYDPYKLYAAGFPYTTDASRYAFAAFTYKSSSGLSASIITCSNSSDSSAASATTDSRYWVTESGFHPYGNSTSRYWRSGRTYKWVAVWKTITY